jgi:hypothetical protein
VSEQTIRTPDGEQDYAGTPRPDAMLPALDEGQLEALRQVGREWDQTFAEPRVWRQALPVDPADHRSKFRPARFTRLVPVAGRDGDPPPIETTSAAETPFRPAARVTQRVTRALIGPPLDVSAIAVERMRKLVALPVLSADALSSVAYGPQAMLAFLVLAGLPGLSYSLPVGGAIMFLMLAVGISYRRTDDRRSGGEPKAERASTCRQPSHADLMGPSRGRAICKVVPAPGGLAIQIRPPSASIRSLSPARPEPRPKSAPPRPSSRTQTCRTPSPVTASTSAAEASAYLAMLVSASATA